MSGSIDNINYRDYFNDPSRQQAKATSKGQVYNAVFSDKNKDEVSMEDFLFLMVEQLKNQDFMNPVDDTQYVTQLAQFSTLKAMDAMKEYSQMSYAMSLAGKDVTVAKFNVSGGVDRATGPVEKVSLTGGEYQVYVDGKAYTLDQIMEINGITNGGSDEINIAKKSVLAEQDGNTVKISWPAASVNSEIAPNLKYTVYYSKSENMSTVEDVLKNGTQIGEADRKQLTEETVNGLNPGETYFFNVVVTDAGGQKYVYQKATLNIEEE